MKELFQAFRDKVVKAVFQDTQKDNGVDHELDNLIALGVLLRVVAEADDKFLPEEVEKIQEVLRKYTHIREEDMPIVMRSIEEASLSRIDLYSFTKEVCHELEFTVKVDIIENLFRVACVDGDLDHEEHEMIRKISQLFNMMHEDFITAKIKVKKEFGLDTAGL